MGTILFTGCYFDNYSGSPIYISEMAEYLQLKGHEIFIATEFLSDKIQADLKEKNITLVKLEDLSLDRVYDLVFAFHHPLISKLIVFGLQYGKIISCCLGPSSPLEAPVCFHDKLHVLTANSEETKQKMIFTDGVIPEKIVVLPNFLPNNFISYKMEKKNRLKKVVVISNHVPTELKELSEELDDISVDIFGVESEQVKVTPEFLSTYDAIISIGKTVQYALGMRIPLFEYDVNGGCGYITIDNYEREKAFNFSGRGTHRKLTAKEIASELKANYAKALLESQVLRIMAIEDFSFKNIDSLLDIIEKTPNTEKATVIRENTD